MNMEYSSDAEKQALDCIEDRFKELYVPFMIGVTKLPEKTEQGEMESLEDILQDFNLNSFTDLFRTLSEYLYYARKGHEFMRMTLTSVANEIIELDSLNALKEELLKGKVDYLNLRLPKASAQVRGKLLNEFGEALRGMIPDEIGMISKEAHESELAFIRKLLPKKGRPSKKFLARVCFLLKDLLNDLTHLKTGESLISNKQAEFIARYLYQCHYFQDLDFPPDLEYIRVTMDNHK